MDRRVKERLVGASILVVLIVLIVPELLSGPPVPAPGIAAPRLPASAPEPVRTVTVDLATSKAPAPEAAEPVAASSAPAASSAAPAGQAASSGQTTGGAAASGQTTGSAATSGQAPSGAAPSAVAGEGASALETAAPPPTSHASAAKPAISGRAWAVQLGSFASRDNADKLLHQLKAQGFPVYVLPGGSGSSPRYRVRIGPMADRSAAAQEAAKLKALGHIASIVPPAA
ncbi:MAG TPA: SPOR domain-containing protein [Steroidobacteraceae bacterium]|nr:SPOR domain-containing protein [Steroidobacteraceae bacterium]